MTRIHQYVDYVENNVIKTINSEVTNKAPTFIPLKSAASVNINITDSTIWYKMIDIADKGVTNEIFVCVGDGTTSYIRIDVDGETVVGRTTTTSLSLANGDVPIDVLFGRAFGRTDAIFTENVSAHVDNEQFSGRMVIKMPFATSLKIYLSTGEITPGNPAVASMSISYTPVTALPDNRKYRISTFNFTSLSNPTPGTYHEFPLLLLNKSQNTQGVDITQIKVLITGQYDTQTWQTGKWHTYEASRDGIFQSIATTFQTTDTSSTITSYNTNSRVIETYRTSGFGDWFGIPQVIPVWEKFTTSKCGVLDDMNMPGSQTTPLVCYKFFDNGNLHGTPNKAFLLSWVLGDQTFQQTDTLASFAGLVHYYA